MPIFSRNKFKAPHYFLISNSHFETTITMKPEELSQETV